MKDFLSFRLDVLGQPLHKSILTIPFLGNLLKGYIPFCYSFDPNGTIDKNLVTGAVTPADATVLSLMHT